MSFVITGGMMFGLMCLETLTIMVYWSIKTRGEWRHWPAGRSMMSLLGIIALITGNAFITRFLFADGYPFRSEIFIALYVILLGALGHIGLTIRSELKKGELLASRKKEAGNGHRT